MKKNNAQPLQPSTNNLQSIDLKGRANQEMVAAGLLPSFEPNVLQEVQGLRRVQPNFVDGKAHDLRSLLWSSIDNPDSKDLDQIEYVEEQKGGNIRVLIAIADVDSFAPKNSAIDLHAYFNTTSVYTGVVTYPMLPDDLSFNLTSLLPDADRTAIIIDLIVGHSGVVLASNIYQAVVRNQAKLDYKMVGDWLESGGSPPDKIAKLPGLADQIRLQNKVKDLMHNHRKQQGSLYLHTPEATTVAENGIVLDLELVEDNPARDLIENFMVSANIAVSHFLESKKIPSIRRIVKTPERWDRIVAVAQSYGQHLPLEPDAKALAQFLLQRKEADPLRFPDLSLTIVKLLGRGEYVLEVPGQTDQGHFALAVRDYTHATAPNRRYPDLVMQRLVKAAIKNSASPYTTDEISKIAIHCTEEEEAAKKVERTMRKVAAAVLLSKHIGETYQAIVTGVTTGGTFVRLLKPPAEGKVIRGEQDLDVGDQIKVKLVSTDPEHAYIDFEKVS